MNGVLVQIVTGEMLVIKKEDWFNGIIAWKHYNFHQPGPNKRLKFRDVVAPYKPAHWIEREYIEMRTDEPLIAVETDKGDIVHVPIKWLMGGEPPWNAEWTVAYHVSGDAMTRVDKIEGREFLRSVRRTDVKEILG